LTSKFKIGDEVTWKSQANGSSVVKTGLVFCVVKAGQPMNRVKAQSALSAQYCDSATWATDFGGFPRKEQSYLVVVPGSVTRAPRVYWPRTSALSLIEE
jgi:hypothetical protein